MCSKHQISEILSNVYIACNAALSDRIHDAILYGSYARGEQHPESDVDILLTADLSQEQISAQRHAIASVASRLSLDYDVTVSIQVVPLAQFRHYADYLPFYQNILKEGIHCADVLRLLCRGICRVNHVQFVPSRRYSMVTICALVQSLLGMRLPL